MQAKKEKACEAVRFRRRGGRPRPPADMEEGWRDGTSRTPAPTGMGVPGCGTCSGPPGTPSPTGAIVPGRVSHKRDVEDAVPYGR